MRELPLATQNYQQLLTLSAGAQGELNAAAQLGRGSVKLFVNGQREDNNNFLNTGIIFPITLRSIRVNGAEGRIALLPWRGFSANLSVTHSRSVSNPPFTGGLYIDNSAVEALSQGAFLIDHDQFLSAYLTAQYTHPGGWWIACRRHT